ncbi:fimbrial assembly chaperone [Pantoea sp. BAV 3049]|uniref:fimbrial assembly chaperone n=1 Tax=Pantoea sp. BAV 3049 TaxID=2654188 RepID=UPI00131CBFFB|nr:fimbrial assembly chaperone [Pantoea sp. BAV 3049]
MRNYRWWSVFSNTHSMAVLLICIAIPGYAVVNTDRTRVVFNSDEMAQSLLLANDDIAPVVMQVWLDEGDPVSSPDNNHTPVVALPPVFRMLPGEVKSLRLMLSSRQNLAAGRENLFWLNLYQIPPGQRASDQAEQQVVMPLRLRLKVLVRPSGVATLQEKDAEKLQFITRGMRLQVTNPTTWYISFTAQPRGQPAIGNLMVAPGESLTVPLSQVISAGEEMTYEVINDTGNRWVYQTRTH